jgi:hypothetical protein
VPHPSLHLAARPDLSHSRPDPRSLSQLLATANLVESDKGEVRRIPFPRTPVNRGQESAEGSRNAEETGMLPYYCSLPKLDPGDLADWPPTGCQGFFCKPRPIWARLR